jgi:hypothetical protein
MTSGFALSKIKQASTQFHERNHDVGSERFAFP